MAEKYDVIVLGLGGMGSAAASRLALRGLRVLGIEQFQAGHDRGSSHGATRVIRQAYYEDPAYVPLLLRAYELWHELERETATELLNLCGGLMIGTPDSEVVAGSLRSARQYGLRHEMLDAAGIRRRFPAFHPPEGQVALFEEKAGVVYPEKATKAHLQLAARDGAVLRFDERVVDWETTASGGVRVIAAGGTYEAEQLVICPGPWAPPVLKGLALPLTVERQILCWFQATAGTELFEPARFPIFIWQASPELQPYGFPAVDGRDGGVKIALYRAPWSSECTPESINRDISAEETEKIREAASPLLPGLDGPCVKAMTCMYTNTPDLNFVIGAHPGHPQVKIACGFSGHGYKFCSAVGEILAELVAEGRTSLPLGPFAPGRFGGVVVEGSKQ